MYCYKFVARNVRSLTLSLFFVELTIFPKMLNRTSDAELEAQMD